MAVSSEVVKNTVIGLSVSPLLDTMTMTCDLSEKPFSVIMRLLGISSSCNAK